MLQLLRRAGTDRTAVAAVEFALLLPVVLMIYVYTVDFARGLEERQKIDRLAATISDVISQQRTDKPVASTTVSDLLAASSVLANPYGSNTLSVTTTVINLSFKADGSCCDARVRWSLAQGGSLRPCNVTLDQVDDVTAPTLTNILKSAVAAGADGTKPGDYVVTDVSAPFEPLFKGLFMFFASGMKKTAYFPVRSIGNLDVQTPLNLPPNQTGAAC